MQRVDGFRDNVEAKWHRAEIGFWVVVVMLLLYSPPAKRLFGVN